MTQFIFGILSLALLIASCKTNEESSLTTDMVNMAELTNKDKAIALVQSLETGDATAVGYINPNKYIQHNPLVADGLEGFTEVLKQKPEGGFKAEVLRSIQDGDYVVTHTKYDFYGPKAGFDIFRFEDGLIVEHWDNLLEEQPPSPSGRTQFDGFTEVTDLNSTEVNKKVVKSYYDEIIIGGKMDRIGDYFDGDTYLQHNPMVADGVSGFTSFAKESMEKGTAMAISKLHIILGEGNFVLGVSEGTYGDKPYAFYDLFRLENNKIIEHWDVMAEVPPESEWKNSNGKFNF